MPGQTSQGLVTPLRVCFAFVGGGIGGAERSMLRLMKAAHPHVLDCSVVLAGRYRNRSLAEAVRAMDIPCHQLTRWDMPGMVATFKLLHPDIVYLFGQIRAILLACAANLAGIDPVVGAERSINTRFVDRLSRHLDRYLLDAYIANSQKAARVLRECVGIPPKRLFVVYNGIEETDKPIPQVPEDVNLGSPSVVCVANILPLKGQIVLLEAIQRLRPQYPQIRAILVGRDRTEGRFFGEVHAKGLDDAYTWTGFVPDVRGYLAAADLFVLPSLYREGMPTSILEAMVVGVPVVATQVGGVDELINDGRTGLLVPPGDPDRLADGIQTLLASDALRQKLVAEAQAHVFRHHTMRRMVEGHVQAFRRMRGETG